MPKVIKLIRFIRKCHPSYLTLSLLRLLANLKYPNLGPLSVMIMNKLQFRFEMQ